MSNPDPFFGPSHLPEPRTESVAWVDLMGTASNMEWSDNVTTINICKLIIAVIEADQPDGLNIYPMMDGVYITHESDDVLSSVFIEIFGRFAQVLTNRYEQFEKNGGHGDDYLRFTPILRGGVAHGDVYHGFDIDADPIDGNYLEDDLLMGEPVARAHLAERESPPFGFKLDSSVNDELAGEVVEWWADDSFGRKAKNGLIEYMSYYRGKSRHPASDEDINRHIDEIIDYFP